MEIMSSTKEYGDGPRCLISDNDIVFMMVSVHNQTLKLQKIKDVFLFAIDSDWQVYPKIKCIDIMRNKICF